MANTPEGGKKRWEQRFEAWVAACNEVHGHKYSYGIGRVLDAGLLKVRITCPAHGEFLQRAAKHKYGQGCPACSGNVALNVRERLEKTFPGQVFPEALPVRNKDKMTLTCPEHGEFKVTLNQLLTVKAAQGVACPKCNIAARGAKARAQDLSERLARAFPSYVFRSADGLRTSDYVEYDCPTHGSRTGVIRDLLGGHGCAECGQEARRDWARDEGRVPLMQNVLDVAAVHGGSLILHQSTLAGTHDWVKTTCVKHGAFEAKLYSIKAGHGCPRCANRVSKGEAEVVAWLRSLGLRVETQCYDTLERGTLDILLPDQGVAIEYCGLYWHSEERRGEKEHLRKMRDAGKAGVRLLTLFEDEWLHRQEAVKTTIKMVLNLDRAAVQARATAVRAAAWCDVEGIYEECHLQGAGTPCAENYVLEHEGRVVAAMSFKPDRFGGYDKELVRYASRGRVVGGFSKLLAQFKRGQKTGTTLVSYCDLRWFTGQAYSVSGFSYVGATSPGYWWCKATYRYSRIKFQKHKLAAKLKKFDADLTEEQNMVANGYWKVWDCGMGKWELTV